MLRGALRTCMGVGEERFSAEKGRMTISRWQKNCTFTPMNYVGEILSLGVAALWTMAALTCELATRHFAVSVVNVWRMLMGLLGSMVLCLWLTGSALPLYADAETWMWMLMSGVVGFFLGDMCLLSSYVYIGSRLGQLLMTTAPIFSALAAWAMMGQRMSLMSVVAMMVTLAGIAVSVLGRGQGGRLIGLKLPLRGVLYGLGAGMGQGLGYVLSVKGLHHYATVVPAEVLPVMEHELPFGANVIRLVAGLVCFGLWLVVKRRGGQMLASLTDWRGLLIVVAAVLTGPVIGVGLSLMASQYTGAGIASTLMATTPIMILLPSRYLFHERITLRSVVGAVISVVGVALFFV